MYQLHHGDCLAVMPTIEANSVDTIITDPPYGLEFMGKDWDHGIPGVRFWREALRVAKPGATLLAFGGTRTFHRLAVAIEDAGWEIRDTMAWLYGQGFPKGKSFYKDMTGSDRETWRGWNVALKPAWEPIIVAQKPRDGTYANNALQHGVAGLWIDGGRVPTEDGAPAWHYPNGPKGRTGNGTWNKSNSGFNPIKDEYTAPAQGRWPANLIHDGSDEVVALFPETAPSKRAAGVKRFGRSGGIMGKVGALRDGRPEGHDDNGGSAARFFYCAKASRAERNAGLEGLERKAKDDHNLSSNACRRCGLRVKANGSGTKCECGDLRETVKLPPAQNHHPTVKPLALMQYLCRLTKTPTGGTVLDPFMGSGTTGIAAVLEGREFIGIEQDADYIEIARRRIEHWQEEERQLELL